MTKRVTLLLAAAVALAFAAPVAANAATGLTETAGTLIPTGRIITFTSTSNSFITTSRTGTITCPSGSVMLESQLTVNSSSAVQGGVGGTTFSATCRTASGATVIVKNMRIKKWFSTGGGTVRIIVAFELELPGGAVCAYESPEDTGTYTPTETATGGGIVSWSEQPVTLLSGACGTTKIDGSFTLATQGTTTMVYLM